MKLKFQCPSFTYGLWLPSFYHGEMNSCNRDYGLLHLQCLLPGPLHGRCANPYLYRTLTSPDMTPEVNRCSGEWWPFQATGAGRHMEELAGSWCGHVG